MTCTTNNGFTPPGTTGTHSAPYNTGVGHAPGYTGGPTSGYPTGNPFTPYFSTQSFWPTGAFTGPVTGEPVGVPGFWQAFQAFCAWTNAQNQVNNTFTNTTPWFNQFNGFAGGYPGQQTGNFVGQNAPWFGNQGFTPSFFNGFNPFVAQNTFGQNVWNTAGNTFGQNTFSNGFNNGFNQQGVHQGFNPYAYGFNTNTTPWFTNPSFSTGGTPFFGTTPFGVTPWNFGGVGNFFGQPVNPAFFSQFFAPSFANTAFWNQNVPYGYTTQNAQNFRGIGLAA